jgi:hypothetical protein
MSLINDALKKAARLRAEERADLVPPMPGGGGRVQRQRAPIRTQTLILVGAAALALIVVSAVITGVLMTGKPEAKPAAAPAQVIPAALPPARVAVSAPVIEVPVPKVAVPTRAPAPAAPTPAPLQVALAPPPNAAPAAAPAPEGHSDQIQGIVDRFHVSGVRAAGADSKALVDGHVYRVNEIIDRSVGLKLVKVDSDHLTFVDAGGNTYLKSF